LSTAADIGTLALPVVTGLGLWFVREQIRGARQVARGQFLLDLDRDLRKYYDVQLNLMEASWEPRDAGEGFQLARYMALFERVGLLVGDGIIDLPTVDRFYGWRIKWLIENHCARKDLENRPAGWEGFIALWRELDELPRDGGGCLCQGYFAPPCKSKRRSGPPRWAANEAYLVTLLRWRRTRT
jgi:hypothetical protein